MEKGNREGGGESTVRFGKVKLKDFECLKKAKKDDLEILISKQLLGRSLQEQTLL